MASKEDSKIVVGEGNFIRFVRKGRWEYVERHRHCGVVIIVAVTRQGNVLLTEQYRPPVEKRVIEFPAGLVDQGKDGNQESIATAAKRELLEETGYKARKIVKILEGPVSGGLCSDKVTMVRAENLEKIGKGGGIEYESITVHEVPLPSVEPWLKKMRAKGCLIEPKIYAGLFFLLADRRF